MDQVLLSRMQFAFTAGYHFIFVPVTIGIGLLMAIFVTRAYKSGKAEDDAIARLWVKIYTATFAIGVATGITMEFSFGTNWASYARYVGDIFGAPLAAEALFSFFLESVFLGIIIFGRKKIKPKLYCVSAWLTFAGSALSALWIIIANSWMQTPSGATLSEDGTEAVITNFFQAAFNPSTIVRYGHTVSSLCVMGAFVVIAVAAFYLLKGKHTSAAKKMLKTGGIAALCSVVVLLGFAHASAVEVWEEQPTKLAMMEGMYESGVPELSVFGIIDESNEEALTLGIPGGTSFLATGTFDAVYPGLNELAETAEFSDIDVSEMPVNFVYQVYHIMVACFGLIVLVLLVLFLFNRKGAKRKLEDMKWAQRLLLISPVFPFLAIQAGWLTAEVGRQPYVVYPSTSAPEGLSLTTANGVSASVQPFELVVTLLLFFVVYLLLFVGWVRVIKRFVAEGPVDEADAAHDADAKTFSFANVSQNSEGRATNAAPSPTEAITENAGATKAGGEQ